MGIKYKNLQDGLIIIPAGSKVLILNPEWSEDKPLTEYYVEIELEQDMDASATSDEVFAVPTGFIRYEKVE